MMISVNEYKFDEDGKVMHKVLDDKELMDSKIYANIYPELYAEIESQYGNNKNQFYYLTETAYTQYQQMRNGLIFRVTKN